MHDSDELDGKKIFQGSIDDWADWFLLREDGYTGVSGDITYPSPIRGLYDDEYLDEPDDPTGLNGGPSYVGGDFICTYSFFVTTHSLKSSSPASAI